MYFKRIKIHDDLFQTRIKTNPAASLKPNKNLGRKVRWSRFICWKM